MRASLLVLAVVACAPATAAPPAPAPPAPAPPTATTVAQPTPPPGPIAAPTLVSPITGAGTFTTRPTIVVALGAGSDGAEIELCADRACSKSLEKLLATGKDGRAHAAPTQPLSGRVFFRARGRRGAELGAAYSPTWQLAVRKGATTLDTSALSFADPALDELKSKNPALRNPAEVGDVDGDGFTDAAGTTCPDAECKQPQLAVATAHGVVPLEWPSAPSGGAGWTAIGDVNGDGFADAVLANGTKSFVYYGSAKGLGAPKPVQVFGGILGWRERQGVDLNGDGYMDLVGAKLGTLGVYFGGTSGLAEEPDLKLPSPESQGGSDGFGDDFGVGDVNGDGLADVVVGAYQGGPARRGRVYVFLGGKTMSTTPAYVIDEPPQQAKSKARPYFGIYLTVRDGDGDGLADIYASTACYLDDKEKGYCKDSVTYLYRGARDGLKVSAPVENVPVPKE